METGVRNKKRLPTGEGINVHFTDDADCEYLTDCPECECLKYCMPDIIDRFLPIPNYVIHKLMRLHPSSVKLFLFVNHCANFQTDHEEYGTCKLSYSIITKATGLCENTIHDDIEELRESRLLECHIDRHPKNEKWFTGQSFTINWMLLDREVKRKTQP